MGASAWGATTWDFSNTTIWGNRTSSANTSIYTGGDSEVYYNTDGTVGTSATSYVSFLYDTGNVSFNYGGRTGLSANGSASTSANRIKVNVPVGASATITVANATTSRKIAVHDGTSVVKEFSSAGSYTYVNTSTTDAKNIYVYNSSNPSDQHQVIKSISIAETVNITTHYYYNDGENNVSIADDNVEAVELGTSYTLPYEETIQSGDYTYTYSSGAQTIASVSASAEYSIYYTRVERQKYSVSVKAKYGDNTVTIVESAEYSEGEVVKYYAPAYYLDGTTLYAFPEDDGDDNNSDGITWGGAYTVTAAKDIVLNYEAQEGEFVAYVEGEALSGAYAQQDYYKDLMSNGTGGVIDSNSPAKVATLPAGVYKLTIRSIGRSSDASARTCSVVVGDETTSWTQVASGSINTLDIILTESTDIKAYGGYKTTSSNAWNLDFIYIQKISDITFALADGEAQHLTFHNAGSGSAAWDNWIIDAYDNTGEKFRLRADYWEEVDCNDRADFHDTFVWSADGGITSGGNIWDTFNTSMQDADCDFTVSYSSGTVYVIGTATKDNNVYYVNYSKSGFTGTAGIYLYGNNATLSSISHSSTDVNTTWVAPSNAITGTIASSGYSTLATAYGLDFANATGLTAAYVVTKTTSDAVTLTSIDELPANSGVILKGTANATYSIPVKADAAYAGTNLLSAAVTATDIEANTAYILQGGLFHLVTAASTVPAGKAYLLKSNVPSAARSLGFMFGDESTGINAVSRDLQNGEFYNLQGQRVDAPKSGLYIVNGKKVLVK